MFKGLRTKIENEQQAPGSRKERNFSNQKTVPSPTRSHQIGRDNNNQSPGSNSTSDVTYSESKDKDQPHFKSENNECTTNIAPLKGQSPTLNHDAANEDRSEELNTGALSLRDQLKAIIEERDECKEHYLQLRQEVDKLKEDLNSEKDINSSLQNKLVEAESIARERTNPFDNFKTNQASKSAISKVMESLNPDGTSSIGQPSKEIIKILRDEFINLQKQMSEKNRQLRIKNQNLNDIKKSLQREIIEHGKTQDELLKFRNHLEQLQQLHLQQQHVSDTEDCVTLQNSSTLDDTEFESNATAHNPVTSDRCQEIGVVSKDSAEDTDSASAISCNQPLDSISRVSKSSASFDDFESNDPHQNSNRMEVNHEYLRNVLFRYMTSTDSETTQHLVKALSVMMNFTPEQSVAIKNAINARSSWLQLK